MANDNLRAESASANPIVEHGILDAAWDAAYSLYRPIADRWEDEYEAADRMPLSPERDAAFKQFYANLPTFQRARDELMRVPAPTIAAVVKKMDIADASSEGHHELCLADLRRLAR